MSDSDIIKDALDVFRQCEERDRDNRAAFEVDISFARLERQWPEEIERQRLKEGRPMHTINKLAPVIRQVVNDARQNKPAIAVRPQDDNADVETAELIGGIVRNIESVSNADIAYDTAVENAVTGGFGYIRVKIDYAHNDTFDKDIVIDRVANPLAVYGDPESFSADGSDWNVAFFCDQFSKKAFEKKYPGADMTDWTGDAMPDGWQEGENITVAEYWTRETVTKPILMLSDGMTIARKEYEAQAELFQALGIEVMGEREVQSYAVKQRLITGREVLETNDWVGCYIPFIPVYGDEVVLKNKRYLRSLIRSAKSSQERYNYWVTAMTEMAALGPKVPYIGEEGAFDADIERWSTANNESHTFLQHTRGTSMPVRQPGPQLQPAMMQEAARAADDIKATTGIYDASLGQRSNETSGVAISARQREGDVSTFHFIDNLNRSIRQVGRVVVDLVPHVYSADRVVRTLGMEGETESVTLGQPVEKDGKTRIYDLSAGKYDVTIKAGPNFTTQREETRAALAELIRGGGERVAEILGPTLVRQMDFPGADDAADRLEGKAPEQGEGGNTIPPQVQAQFQQMQQMIQQGMQQMQALEQENQQLKTDRELDRQKLLIDAEKVQVDRLKAETEAIRAQAEIRQAAMAASNPYGVEQPQPTL